MAPIHLSASSPILSSHNNNIVGLYSVPNESKKSEKTTTKRLNEKKVTRATQETGTSAPDSASASRRRECKKETARMKPSQTRFEGVPLPIQMCAAKPAKRGCRRRCKRGMQGCVNGWMETTPGVFELSRWAGGYRCEALATMMPRSPDTSCFGGVVGVVL